jgi:hypothetical protein
MSLVKNLSESERMQKAKTRVEYSNYLTSLTRFNSGLSPDFIKVESGSGAVRAASFITSFKPGPVYLIPTEYDNIIVNNSPSTNPTTAPVSNSNSVPGQPTDVFAIPFGLTLATIRWQAPISDGGSPILSYRVTSSPGGLIKSTTNMDDLAVGYTNLITGTEYTFTVIAINAIGPSLPSIPSNPIVAGNSD